MVLKIILCFLFVFTVVDCAKNIEAYSYNGIIINWITLYNSLSPACQYAFSDSYDNPVANYTDLSTPTLSFCANFLVMFATGKKFNDAGRYDTCLSLPQEIIHYCLVKWLV